MDLTTITTATNNLPDAENETPPPATAQPNNNNNNSLSFTNGKLKKHTHHHHPPLPPALVVNYKECLKNHAASLGAHAVDGCGEFMCSPTANPTDPISLKCVACGCHRNFHRREDDPTTTQFLDFHRHPPLPPPAHRSSPSSSPSPPPPPHHPSYYSSAPHMLLALSTADEQPNMNNHHPVATPATPTAAKAENPSGRKRNRTKFSQEQKEKMFSFSEKLGWKMQKSDEGLVEEFCNEVGVGKGVLKVWMHNNKHTFGKRDTTATAAAAINDISNNSNGRVLNFDNNNCNTNTTTNNNNNNHHHQSENNNGVHLHVSTNGCPSSA